ncbi:MAG: dihydrolipoyllysine acetyltransferase [Dehalococcoidales bacterium]|nr:dihydrolipoyllysine acetyltransferase [Dehalococcoidales bacterium]MDP6825191.1 dihydrolipoamide acetyltransferase family protein [Dehalococcoidales bacterium]
MTTEIKVPRLGMAVADATIIEWKVKEEEQVAEKQVVVVIETEKLKYDVESPAAGFIHILLKEGDTAPVGKVIGLIAASKEELTTLPETAPAQAATTSETSKGQATPAATLVTRGEGKEKIRISPVARKLAEEHAIDVIGVTGTGPGGRITREDVEKAIAGPAGAVEGKRIKQTIPLRGMRGSIAEHMHRSLSVSAQLTAMGEIDLTQMVKLRKDLVDQKSALGTRVTYTDLLVLALAQTLKEHPFVNSSLIDNEIKIWEDINIGVAVAMEEGLIVPVVKAADKKSLKEISQTVKTLAEKAREGKLVAEEITGGTFTLSNLGAVGAGYRFETVIINQPESAILGTGAITERAVVRDGQIVIRPIMTYYLTYDHRVVNGAVAANFMASVIKLLENPNLLSINR